MSERQTRAERDALGTISVPAEALYGAHTARSLDNFGSAGERLDLDLIRAMAWIKIACARTNARLGRLNNKLAAAIEQACRTVLAGEVDDHFPIDVFQAGSGTSSHMNLNEVLANLASEKLGGRRGEKTLVHPNDHVNLGQSTNNVFPSAIRIAVRLRLPALEQAAKLLIARLQEASQRFGHIVKAARTHLQDAVPITLGAEFGAWARAMEKDVLRIEAADGLLRELGVGGNAVGTGLNNPPEFRQMVVDELNQLLGADYIPAANGVEATMFLTDLVHTSACLRSLAIDLYKITSDLRLLSSGPHTGLREIQLPPVEPGSSMMPGKINPSICEATGMACLHLLGLDASIATAGALGQLELNTHMPLIGQNLLRCVKIMEDCCQRLAEKCVSGIQANEKICRWHLERSAALVTILAPRLGYDRAAALASEAVERDCDIGTLVLEKGLLTHKEWEELLQEAVRPNG